jgi:hypothetical protein
VLHNNHESGLSTLAALVTMRDSLLLAAGAMLALFIVQKLLALRKNIAIAKQSGLPYIVARKTAEKPLRVEIFGADANFMHSLVAIGRSMASRIWLLAPMDHIITIVVLEELARVSPQCDDDAALPNARKTLLHDIESCS